MVRIRGRQFVPVVLAGGALAAALLAASTTGTLSGFVATIANSTDTAASGTLTMQEQNSAATVTCTSNATSVSSNSATCSTINKYGGNTAMTPGQSVSTTITIKNTGTVAASSFTLTPGACTQSNNGSVNGSATDLCSQMTVAIVTGSSPSGPTVFPSGAATSPTLTALYNGYNPASPNAVSGAAPISLGTVAAGATLTYTFTVTLPSTLGNTYQGLSASQPLTWTFNS